VPDSISIFEVIKRGGYEASLITTFNATLPFYEEVVLRKLVAAGCRHNVVLMDRRQCAVAWESEATRPRLAGYAYTLLPVGVAAAFHPKVCLLLGKKKASVLIGSHNLTLSGFGYNREVTNLVEVAGPKDAEGAALLAATWKAVQQWIELERDMVPAPLLDAALAISNFVAPLVANAESSESTFLLAQVPDGPSLIDQLAAQVPVQINRIGVIGAFFDQDQMFIKALHRRWPSAEIVVGIDPDSVYLQKRPAVQKTRFVDARPMWDDEKSYLHAKVIYLRTETASTDILISGSANPSRPAWMAHEGDGNVEAVLLRKGQNARSAAKEMRLDQLFRLPALADDVVTSIIDRTSASKATTEPQALPIWSGIADADTGELHIATRGALPAIDLAICFGPNLEVIERIGKLDVSRGRLGVRPTSDLASIRSCVLVHDGQQVARAVIQHPGVLSASARTSKQSQIRSALGALGSNDADISTVIATVERVIFSDESVEEVEAAMRAHKDKRMSTAGGEGPNSLEVSVNDLPKVKRKLRLLKSGDLVYLIDVLLRRLSEGLETRSVETDSSGRTEEEQVGQDDVEGSDSTDSSQPAKQLVDLDIAKAVAHRARTLVKKMLLQLERAADDEDRRSSAVVQLIAVLALIRELRHLDRTPRWRKTGHALVQEEDRATLLDGSIAYLLGSTTHLIDWTDKAAGEVTDEGTQLRVLLLWLAWDLGDELTDKISRTWEADELRYRLLTNAMFTSLLPPIAYDRSARADLERSIAHTNSYTPQAVARATEWIQRHFRYGKSWSQELKETQDLHVGGFCRVRGQTGEPHVIIQLTSELVYFWDYEENRGFMRSRIVGVTPIK
jgi:hypothetical protein